MKLPTLYKLTKTGAVQMFEVEAVEDTVIVRYGQVGGKVQTKCTIAHPKNIGKKNETTSEEQALLEAQAKHAKKIKSGYSPSIDNLTKVKLPMKVKSYIGNEHKVMYPCVSTIKYNGVNALYLLEEGELNLYSRGGNRYPAIPHIEKVLLPLMEKFEVNAVNGELYIHGEHLQDITSAVKKVGSLSPLLTLHIFDLPEEPGSYLDRRNSMILMHSYLKRIPQQAVTFELGIVCATPMAVDRHYKKAINNGYEGTVIKNFEGAYVYDIRSNDQYKYKETQDGEYRVIGVHFDKNDHAVYECATKNEGRFKVKRKGTNNERLRDAEKALDNLGKFLTVEYEMLSKDGIPLKPVGLGFRDCDNNGTPIT